MSDSSFPPETIDEQTGQHPAMLPPEDTRLVGDLHRVYQPLADDNARSLERVRARLAQHEARFSRLSFQRSPLKDRYMKTPFRIFTQDSAWRRGISAATAIAMLVVLVGSMAALFTLQGHSKNAAKPGQAKDTPAASTTATLPNPPASFDVYVLTNTAVSKLDPLTKQPVWTQQIGQADEPVAVSGESVYVSAWEDTAGGSSNYVYALNATTGAVRWKVLVNRDVTIKGQDGSGPYDLGYLTAPVINNGTLYVGARDGKFFALDAATGKQHWVYMASATALVSDPVTIDGTIYYNYTIYDGGPVVVDQGVMYGSLHNALFAVDVKTGKQLWSKKVDSHQILNGPVVVNGAIYLSSYEESNHSNPFNETGAIYAYASTDGRQLWQHNVDGWVLSSPTIDHEVVYFGTFNFKLYALKASNGSELWHYNTQGEIYDQPLVVDGIVYTEENGNGSEGTGSSTVHSALFAINASSGKLVWQKSVDLDNLLAVQDGVIYVTAYPGTLYGYSTKDGSLLWQRQYSPEWIVLVTLAS
jgi:outer membrane protein assembly factor BamB